MVWLDRLLETITLIGVSVSEPHTSVLNCDFSLLLLFSDICHSVYS